MNYHSFWKQILPVYEEGEAKAIARIVFGQNLVDDVEYIMIGKENEKISCQAIVDRLLKNEPIQYILEKTIFNNRYFIVKPGVLIPRPETEELVQLVCKTFKNNDKLKILDCCTGSGCIAISLALDFPNAEIWAYDISDKALEIARLNSERLCTHVNFFKADALNDEDVNFYKLKEINFNIIISNPPYVCESEKINMEQNVLKYEPSEALFVSDSNPIIFYKSIGAFALRHMTPTAKLFFEINPNYSGEIKTYLLHIGFSNVDIILDDYGKKRFILGNL